MLPYPSSHDSENPEDPPLALALSSFHFILLYKNCLKAVCELNGELVYDDIIPLERDEYIMGVTTDPVKGTFWVYSNLVLYELLITDEDRDVWKLYLKNMNFDAALSYAKTDSQLDTIVTSQAEYQYNQKNFELAAQYFAQSKMKPFEEIALKFIDVGETGPLKIFLTKKLERTKRQ
ncbi:hypothetical protein HDU67_005068, partial [Dinochytrium kinnereticum]